jgi:tetratricopeptide (TPR) repeat protein
MMAPMRSEVALPAWPKRLLVGGLLLLAALVAYAPALSGGFIWDDDAHVTAPALRSTAGLWRIWIDPHATQQYYPLAHSVFWLEHRLWGADPIGYHVVNVVLHVAGAFLAWLTLDRLAVPGALFAAAVFALHPVHVESVAWVTELKNTLSGVFYLSALAVYLRFDPVGVVPLTSGQKERREPARRWSLYGIALALYVCALLTKTVTASLPAAIVLIAWWKEGRVDWRRRAVPLIPFFAIGIALGATTAWVERHLLGAEGEAFAFTAMDRMLIAGRALWFYAGKLLWPANLIFVYPRWRVDPAIWWQYLFPAAALALVIALVALRRQIGRGPLAAVLFFGGTLVPALGFFNVYPFVYSFVADHFQYLASLGLIALGAALIATALARLGIWGRPAGHAVCGLLLLVLAGLTWRQAHIYANVEILYRDIMARNPTAGMPYLNLATLYAQQGRHGQAIELLHTLIAIRPDYASAYSNLGIVYAGLGRYPEAIAEYRRAIALNPASHNAHYNLGLAHAAQGRPGDAVAEYRAALAIRPEFAEAHYELALAEAVQGRSATAIAEYQAALAIEPNLVKAYQGLGAAYTEVGRYREAVAALKAAVAIKPDLAVAHYGLGMAFGALGEPAQAIAAYRAAIAAKPDYSEAYNNLGLLYRRQGQASEAIAAYRAAIAIKPDFAAAYNNLGAAYGAQGQLTEAIDAWQRAARLDPSGATGRTAEANIEIARAHLRR